MMDSYSSYSNRFPKWSIKSFFILFYLLWAISSASPTSEVIDQEARNKTLVCQDGTYEYEGRTCCYCPAGWRVKKHCSKLPGDRICELCVQGETYSSTHTSQESCEPCTSCSQISANLEVEEACTIARNTVCRCKKDHYCKSGKETCTACQPCEKCDVEGIEVACTATSNTVCKVKESGGVNLVAVIIPVVLIMILLVLFIWKRKYFTQLLCGERTEVPSRPTEDMEPLRGVDLSSHLPDIAAELGWKVMRNVALHSGKTVAAIQYHELNHPNDSEERTFQLLSEWVEEQGSEASSKLIETLRRDGKNGIANKVMDIIKRNGNSNGQHVPA